ncbi:TetR/AcrR family transcriptional regulator [Stenotrophomonas acidaminiphila]|uniref:TetR/AcrR family transcriptional regulator n=1 Tax=Stenotrophomonas acidaminiphila TaxID=128780 RepID=UPI0039BC7514
MTHDAGEKHPATIDDKLARALALAIAKMPRANLQQIASSAGISRATLYRISPTREGLVDMLTARANDHLQQALADAALDRPPAREALGRLTENVMKAREFYLFWSAMLWNSMLEVGDSSTPSLYGQTLEQFFLNGQQTGIFRIDMPAKWLATSYDYLLYAAIDSAQRGEIATVGLASMVERTLFGGISPIA